MGKQSNAVRQVESSEVLKELASWISSESVLILGTGKSMYVAALIADTLVSLGIDAQSDSHNNLMHGALGKANYVDNVIHISSSGSTPELLLAEYHIARTTCAYQLLLTIGESHKTKSCKVFPLPTDCGDELTDFGSPTTSTTCFVAAGMRLGHLLTCYTAEDFAATHPGGKWANG